MDEAGVSCLNFRHLSKRCFLSHRRRNLYHFRRSFLNSRPAIELSVIIDLKSFPTQLINLKKFLLAHDPNDDYERSNQTKKPHSLNNKYTNESDQSDSESRPPATSTAIPRRSILPTSSLPTGGGESTSYSPPPTSSRSKNQMQMMANMRKSSQPPSNNNIDSTESNSQLINHLQNSDSDVSNYAQRQSNRQNQSLAQRKSIASPPTNLDHLPSNKLKQLNKQTVSKRIEMNENEMSSSPQLWPDSAADSQNVDNNTRNDVNNRQQDYVASSPSPPPGSSASVSDLRRNGVKKPGQYGNLMNLAASTQAVNMDAEDRFLNKEANMVFN